MKKLVIDSESSVSRPIIVDRINTTQLHRQDVFGSLKSGGIRIVVTWDMKVPDCLARVKSRQYGHKSIHPEDNVGMILGRTNKELEPLSDEEIVKYGINKVISLDNVAMLSREQVLRTILDGISEFDARYKEIGDDLIALAVQAAAERERVLASENERSAPIVFKPVGPPVREGRYEVCMEETQRFRQYFQFFNDDVSFIGKSDFHITLLYINRGLAAQISADAEKPTSNRSSPASTPDSVDVRGPMYSPTEYRKAISQYRCLNGKPVSVRLKYIAKNDRVMAIRVEFARDQILHFNVVPHISVGKIPAAEFRESNQLIMEVERLKREGMQGQSSDGKVSWIDLHEDILCSGAICFKKHGSK